MTGSPDPGGAPPAPDPAVEPAPQPEPGPVPVATDDTRREVTALAARVAALEARSASPARVMVRVRAVARVVRAAARVPSRRRRVVKDVARAALGRTAGGKALSAGPTRYPLPTTRPPLGPVARPGLTVAVLLDPFSELAFRYEWRQVTFGPSDWREVLERTPPDLLFVESAWNGNDGRWRLHMTRDDRPSDELRALLAWARERGVPSVFWNKEDPPNYARFIETARLFDRVLTVDADRIPAYVQDLGHDRVGLLPFAAQPRIHNPVRRGTGRCYDVAFAGTYFADKHDERRAQMEYVLEPALEHGLHIYSRLQGGDERYRFPARYTDSLVGSLPYEQMLAAYTSYKVFLNVNSVTGSPSMCSRRLFELSAAQTAVVSGPAASIQPFLGDALTVVTDAEQTRKALAVLVRQDEFRDRLALRAHRRVFDEHLYSHRVDAVLRAVGREVVEPDRSVSAVVPTMRPEQLDHVLDFAARQSHDQVELVLVTHGFEVDDTDLKARAAARGLDRVVVRAAEAALTLGECMNLGVDAASGTYVAKMDDDNHYGRHYLKDLVRAFDYTDAQVVGKWAHLTYLEGSQATLLRFPQAEHRYTRLVQGGTIVTRRETAAQVRFEPLPRRVDTTFLEKVGAVGGHVYSSDRFNYVSVRRASVAGHTWKITEEDMLAGKADLLFYGEPFTHAEA